MDDRIDPAALYAPEEVAALNGVTYAAGRGAITLGELAATRIGRVWAVRGADALAWKPRRWPPNLPQGRASRAPERARLGNRTGVRGEDIDTHRHPRGGAGGSRTPVMDRHGCGIAARCRSIALVRATRPLWRVVGCHEWSESRQGGAERVPGASRSSAARRHDAPGQFPSRRVVDEHHLAGLHPLHP